MKDLDQQFVCKDCAQFGKCKYYHNRQEDSQICKYFHLFPDNATNGDVIKAMFPSAKIEESTLLAFMFAQGFDVSLIDSEWWDALYKKESAGDADEVNN